MNSPFFEMTVLLLSSVEGRCLVDGLQALLAELPWLGIFPWSLTIFAWCSVCRLVSVSQLYISVVCSLVSRLTLPALPVGSNQPWPAIQAAWQIMNVLYKFPYHCFELRKLSKKKGKKPVENPGREEYYTHYKVYCSTYRYTRCFSSSSTFLKPSLTL